MLKVTIAFLALLAYLGYEIYVPPIGIAPSPVTPHYPPLSGSNTGTQNGISYSFNWSKSGVKVQKLFVTVNLSWTTNYQSAGPFEVTCHWVGISDDQDVDDRNSTSPLSFIYSSYIQLPTSAEIVINDSYNIPHRASFTIAFS